MHALTRLECKTANSENKNSNQHDGQTCHTMQVLRYMSKPQPSVHHTDKLVVKPQRHEERKQMQLLLV